MRLSLVTPADAPPITVAEAKTHLRVDGSEEDALIASMIGAAVDVWEGETHRQVGEATYDLILPGFPARGAVLSLPRPPLQSVVSVTYIDTSGAEVVWDEAEYVVTKPQGPFAGKGFLAPAHGFSYPSTARRDDAVRVRFVAGYPDGEVPDAVKLRLMLLTADLYANRESQVVGPITSQNRTVALLVNPFRIPVYA